MTTARVTLNSWEQQGNAVTDVLAHPAHVVLLYSAEWQRKSYEDNG